MNSGAPAGQRRLLSCLLALVLSGTVLAGRAIAATSVTHSDLAAAEAAAGTAEQNLAAARAALAAAIEDRSRLVATLDRLEEQRRSDVESAASHESALRSRIATLYMSAGGRALTVVVVGAVTTFSTRVAYLAAVNEDDSSAVNRFLL